MKSSTLKLAKQNVPAPPKQLGDSGKEYFKLVAEAYHLQPDDVPLLTSCCEMLDRAESAKVIIGKEGLTFVDRFGQTKAHPAVDVERQSRLAFVRIRRELGLDAVPPPDSRPPLARGYR